MCACSAHSRTRTPSALNVCPWLRTDGDGSRGTNTHYRDARNSGGGRRQLRSAQEMRSQARLLRLWSRCWCVWLHAAARAAVDGGAEACCWIGVRAVDGRRRRAAARGAGARMASRSAWLWWARRGGARWRVAQLRAAVPELSLPLESGAGAPSAAAGASGGWTSAPRCLRVQASLGGARHRGSVGLSGWLR